MGLLGISQNEVARRAGVTSCRRSPVMVARANSPPGPLTKPYGVFERAGAAGNARRGEGTGLWKGGAEQDGGEGCGRSRGSEEKRPRRDAAAVPR